MADLVSFMQKQQVALERMGPKEEMLQKKKSKRSSSLSEKNVQSMQQHVTAGLEKMNLEFRDQTFNFIHNVPPSPSLSSAYPLSSSPSPTSSSSSNLHHSTLFQSTPNLHQSSSSSSSPSSSTTNLHQSSFSASSPNLHHSPSKGERRRSKEKGSFTSLEDPSFSSLGSPLSSSTLSLISSSATSTSTLSLNSSSLNLNLNPAQSLPFPAISSSSSSPSSSCSSSAFSYRNPPKFGQITPTYPSHPSSSGSSTASSPSASPFPADPHFPPFEGDEPMGDLEQEEQWDTLGEPLSSLSLPRRRSSTVESLAADPYSRAARISASLSDPDGLSRYDRESNILMDRRNSNTKPRSRSRSPMLAQTSIMAPSASKGPRFSVKRRLSLTAAHSSPPSSSLPLAHLKATGHPGAPFTSSSPRRASLPELHAPVFGYSLKRSSSNSDNFEEFLAMNSGSSPSLSTLSTLSTVPDAPEEWEEDLEGDGGVLPRDFIKEISSVILENEYPVETPMSFLNATNLVQLSLAPLTPLNPSTSQYSELRCHADLFEDR